MREKNIVYSTKEDIYLCSNIDKLDAILEVVTILKQTVATNFLLNGCIKEQKIHSFLPFLNEVKLGVWD